jgi:hypothetical protein
LTWVGAESAKNSIFFQISTDFPMRLVPHFGLSRLSISVRNTELCLVKTLWEKEYSASGFSMAKLPRFACSSSQIGSLQVQLLHLLLEFSCTQRLSQSIGSLLFGSHVDKLHLPIFNLLTLEVHRQLYMLCLRIEFRIAGKRLSALVICVDLE